MGSFSRFLEAQGVVPEAGQHEYIRVAFDCEDPVPGPIWGDVSHVPAGARITVGGVIGRRSGKTYFGALRMLHLALTVPVELAPGEEANVQIFAPTVKLARQAFNYIKGAINRLPAVKAMVVGQVGAEAVVLRRKDGVTVRIVVLAASAGGASARGVYVLGALLEEACFFRDQETGAVNDTDIYNAIEPGLVPGAQIVVQSTPWAPSGLLHGLWKANYGHPTTALIAHAPTSAMRSKPWILEKIERSWLRDAENTEREYNAKWPGGVGSSWFDATTLDASEAAPIASPIIELDPLPGEELTAGADLAFTKNGAVLVVAGRLAGRSRVVYLEEVRPTAEAPLVPSVVLAHFASVLARYRGCPVMADGHYKESFREALIASGLALRPAPEGAQGKALVHTHARVLLREGKLTLPNHGRLVRQLRERSSKLTSGGALAFHSPTWTDGAHGDIADALLLALYQPHGVAVPGLRVVKDPFDAEEEYDRERRDVRGMLTGARRR